MNHDLKLKWRTIRFLRLFQMLSHVHFLLRFFALPVPWCWIVIFLSWSISLNRYRISWRLSFSPCIGFVKLPLHSKCGSVFPENGVVFLNGSNSVSSSVQVDQLICTPPISVTSIIANYCTNGSKTFFLIISFKIFLYNKDFFKHI